MPDWREHPPHLQGYRYLRDLSDDFRVHPGDETSDLAGREGMGQQPKMLVVLLTPTAAIAVAQLDKVDRAVILGTPGAGQNFSDPRIDLHEGARAENGKERVVFESYIPVEVLANVKLLDQGDGDLTPNFDHTGK